MPQTGNYVRCTCGYKWTWASKTTCFKCGKTLAVPVGAGVRVSPQGVWGSSGSAPHKPTAAENKLQRENEELKKQLQAKGVAAPLAADAMASVAAVEDVQEGSDDLSHADKLKCLRDAAISLEKAGINKKAASYVELQTQIAAMELVVSKPKPVGQLLTAAMHKQTRYQKSVVAKKNAVAAAETAMQEAEAAHRAAQEALKDAEVNLAELTLHIKELHKQALDVGGGVVTPSLDGLAQAETDLVKAAQTEMQSLSAEEVVALATTLTTLYAQQQQLVLENIHDASKADQAQRNLQTTFLRLRAARAKQAAAAAGAAAAATIPTGGSGSPGAAAGAAPAAAAATAAAEAVPARAATDTPMEAPSLDTAVGPFGALPGRRCRSRSAGRGGSDRPAALRGEKWSTVRHRQRTRRNAGQFGASDESETGARDGVDSLSEGSRE